MQIVSRFHFCKTNPKVRLDFYFWKSFIKSAFLTSMLDNKFNKLINQKKITFKPNKASFSTLKKV